MVGVHSTRAAQALAHLGETDPALSVLALWCRHRDDDGPTRTEGETILYGPSFPLMPLQEQVGLVAHHVLHVALCHSARAGTLAERFGDDFDPGLYNLAADGLINDTLIAAGHAVPRPAAQASALLTALGDGVVGPAQALAEWDADRLYLHLAARAPKRKGLAEDAKRYARSIGFEGDLKPGGASAEGDGPPDQGSWRGRLLGALAAGREAGTGVGLLAGRIADLPQPRIPWELRLRRLLAKAVSEVPRRSHRRPAARWCAAEDRARRTGRPVPVFEPGTQRDGRRPRIAVCLDTSGSVAEGPLQLFAAEAGAIARRSGAEIRVLGFDTEVHADITMAPGAWDTALTEMEVRQAGGTDFAPVLAEAAAWDPALIIVLTDLDGPLGAAPQVPVLWAVPSPPSRPPAFGTVLDMGR